MHQVYSVSTDSRRGRRHKWPFFSQPLETWQNLAQSTRLAEEPYGKSLLIFFDLNLLKFCHAE